MADFPELYDAIVAGNSKRAVEIVEMALSQKADPEALVNRHMIPAMDEVGRRFEAGDYFVPELLIAGRAMQKSLALIRPLLARKGAKPVGRVVIGTVKGDLHDIGKNLVTSMLEGAGFEIFDLGVDVSPEKFVAALRERQARLLALSALLTTTMPSMKAVVDAVESAGLRPGVRIIVGGAPLTQGYADEIGVDGYSDNANGAVTLARKLAAEG
jgi:methylmalonyl-CoA mutase cobalamin-binding domain/chain